MVIAVLRWRQRKGYISFCNGNWANWGPQREHTRRQEPSKLSKEGKVEKNNLFDDVAMKKEFWQRDMFDVLLCVLFFGSVLLGMHVLAESPVLINAFGADGFILGNRNRFLSSDPKLSSTTSNNWDLNGPWKAATGNLCEKKTVTLQAWCMFPELKSTKFI